MNKQNSSVLLVGLSVLMSMTALIAVAAHWPNTSGTTTVVTRASAVQPAKVQTVHVVMHDPGCHWFQTDGGLKRTLNIKGPVNLANMDEAALKVVGVSGTKIDHVGSAVRLKPGTYHITMVGQQPDDNHLKLTVS
jgi:hypothetical protein